MGALMNARSLVGQPVDALVTPALIVDTDALEHNLKLLADYFKDRHAKLRPHFKSHKCVTLAHRQLAAGSATGICAAKISEAEVLVAAGIADVLVANQVVGMPKARRLVALAKKATVRAVVDSPENVEELGAAAAEAGIVLGCLVEVDVGMKRCGVPPGEPTVALARKVHETDSLRLDGLHGFEGHIVLNDDRDLRTREAARSMELLVGMRRALERAGLPCPLVSAGGSGTYDVTGNVEGIDEVQAGSYALMDACYRKVRPELRQALFVLSTVISVRENLLVGDVGLKGMGNDFGFPLVADHPEAEVMYVAEEHVPIRGMSGKVGDRIRLIPTHGCTTCNLHRRMWIVRENQIEDVWPIEGSGCLE